MSWLDDVPFDPIPPLAHSGNPAIEYWTRRDVLDEETAAPRSVLWGLRIPAQIVRHQNADGSWPYPGRRPRDTTDYDLLETTRQLGFLIEMFGFTREHPAVAAAAEYVLTKQTAEGDLRGIYGNQYSPNYTAALLELLVKAGYEEDGRISKSLDWLEGMQQDGGGWALPLRTHGRNLDALSEAATLQPRRAAPFSHLITGVVLRAYAAHPRYRHGETATSVARQLADRFFERDSYPDRNHVSDWTEFSYPFWQTDLLSSLNSVSLIDPSLASSQKVLEAKQWFVDHQDQGGLFTGHLLKDRYHDLRFWYSLAVCRVFKRL